MNIFSQADFNGVQEVTNQANGNFSHLPSELAPDEMEGINHQSQRIQELVEKIDRLKDPEARDLMQQCMQELLGFYGRGLERILKIISNGNSTAAKNIYNDLVEDSFVSGLLLIHDLHPLDLKTRLYQAIDKVKPYIDSHGGSVELVNLVDGVATLKLSGSCKSCPSSSSTLELGIKQAVEEFCPDLVGLEVEGIAAAENHANKSAPKTDMGWRVIKGVAGLKSGEFKHVEIPGAALLVSRVKNQLYAYRDLCPACDRAFTNATLEDNVLSCRLGHRYDIHLAGICSDDPALHLEPVPLLEADGVVKIAI